MLFSASSCSTERKFADMQITSFATVLTREGVSSPADLSQKGQEEFYKNHKPRRARGHSTSDPVKHPKGGKVNRKNLAKLHARQSARTATLASNKNATESAYRMPGSNK